MSLYASVPNWIQEIPDHLKAQKMCTKSIKEELWLLRFVPDRFWSQEMCAEAVHNERYLLQEILDDPKIQRT